MAEKEKKETKEEFLNELIRIYEIVGVFKNQDSAERLAEAYKKEGYSDIASRLSDKYKALQH